MEILQSYHSPATEDDMNTTDFMEGYYFWRKLSRCVKCHAKDAFTMNGRCMCAECADKANAYYREYWREHPELSEKRRLRRKERRERLKTEGLCVACGKRKAVPGKTNCSVCAAKQNRKNRKAYAKCHPAKPERGADGMCTTCRKFPALEGYKLCAECYRKIVERSRSISHDAHPWRLDDSKMYEEKRTTRKQWQTISFKRMESNGG